MESWFRFPFPTDGEVIIVSSQVPMHIINITRQQYELVQFMETYPQTAWHAVFIWMQGSQKWSLN